MLLFRSSGYMVYSVSECAFIASHIQEVSGQEANELALNVRLRLKILYITASVHFIDSFFSHFVDGKYVSLFNLVSRQVLCHALD